MCPLYVSWRMSLRSMSRVIVTHVLCNIPHVSVGMCHPGAGAVTHSKKLCFGDGVMFETRVSCQITACHILLGLRQHVDWSVLV